MTEKYSYREFKIVIDSNNKWDYRKEEMGKVYTWEVQHTGGWRLEYSYEPHEDINKCKKAAEKCVDRLYGGW